MKSHNGEYTVRVVDRLGNSPKAVAEGGPGYKTDYIEKLERKVKKRSYLEDDILNLVNQKGKITLGGACRALNSNEEELMPLVIKLRRAGKITIGGNLRGGRILCKKS